MRFGVVWREVCLSNYEDYENWIANRDSLDANDVVDSLIEKLKLEGFFKNMIDPIFSELFL